MTKGMGGGLTPEQGTVSTMRCLFDELPGNGLFFGSDGLRSPIHVPRNPGEKLVLTLLENSREQFFITVARRLSGLRKP